MKTRTNHGAEIPAVDLPRLVRLSDAEKYAEPHGSKERVEEQLRIALDGHTDSELWGETGLIAATMRAAHQGDADPLPRSCSPPFESWLEAGAARWLATAEALGDNHPDYIDTRKCSWAYQVVLEELRQENDKGLATQPAPQMPEKHK